MEIIITEKIIETVCNSLRASKYSLQQQLRLALDKRKEEILKSQLTDAEEALLVFEKLEVQ